MLRLFLTANRKKNSEIINQCSGLNQLQSLQLLKTPTGKTLAYIAPTMDNVPQVANAMKILIESTYNILLEKNL